MSGGPDYGSVQIRDTVARANVVRVDRLRAPIADLMVQSLGPGEGRVKAITVGESLHALDLHGIVVRAVAGAVHVDLTREPEFVVVRPPVLDRVSWARRCGIHVV